jgi:2-polyprenyl-3-methyl-5-hydroxy-6-metoxy-1,4-benzoquinol methylase
VYRNKERMTDYMLGLVCTQFAWPNHFDLFCFFEDKFVRGTAPNRILEIAPGHGLFGLTLLEQHSAATLLGIDISPASVILSQEIARLFGVTRATYLERDALELPPDFVGAFDTVICGELMEHLPEPVLLCRNIARALGTNGVGYLTAAITAAAPDHIYEFKSEDEVLSMFESGGLSVESYICVGTRALTDRAKGVPRTLAAVVRPQ